MLEETFIQRVTAGHFPEVVTASGKISLDKKTFINLFTAQLISRQCDLWARTFSKQARVFYTIGSAGHEALAAIAFAFRNNDMAFLHYRDAALLIQRLSTLMPQQYIIETLLHSFMVSAHDPISGGRHKVLGHVAAWVPPQTSTIASHLPKAVGAAASISRAKKLKLSTPLADDAVILCSFGDASVNHASATSAFNSAASLCYRGFPMPIVFICEDNGWGISVPTPKGWIEANFKHRLGIHYIQANGVDLNSVYNAAKQAEHIARIEHKPVFLHLQMVRLMGHAGDDFEPAYRNENAIAADCDNDPLLHSARQLIDNDWLNAEEIIDIHATIKQQVVTTAERLLECSYLNSVEKVKASIVPPSKPGTSQTVEKIKLPHQNIAKLDLCDHLNTALHEILQRYPRAILFGQDIGQKGGVYGVSKNLLKTFGNARVFDTLVDETAMLGNAIGHAHNGFIPIVEIQFLAYLHNAIDQIRGEAATLPFFSNGQFTNPMLVRLPAFAYQQGFGGHFHNENTFASLRDIPGIVIACPSIGNEASNMLRECIRLVDEQQRVVLFLEPIALYHKKDLLTDDGGWLTPYPDSQQTIRFGELGIDGKSAALTIITYGNGYYLSKQAAHVLHKKHGIDIKIINLRWLAPLNETAIVDNAKQCKHILIVDECRKTASVSEQIIALLLEQCKPLPMIKRLCAADSFIPTGRASQVVLPSQQDIIDNVLMMLE